MKVQLQNIYPCYIHTVVLLGLMKWYFHDFYIQTGFRNSNAYFKKSWNCCKRTKKKSCCDKNLRAKFSFYYKRALTQNNNTSYSSSKDTFLVLIKVALFWHWLLTVGHVTQVAHACCFVSEMDSLQVYFLHVLGRGGIKFSQTSINWRCYSVPGGNRVYTAVAEATGVRSGDKAVRTEQSAGPARRDVSEPRFGASVRKGV